MARILTPILFLAAGAGVLAWNGAHDSEVILFPGLDALMPTLAGDLQAQGRVSAYLLMAMGLVLALYGLLERTGRSGTEE